MNNRVWIFAVLAFVLAPPAFGQNILLNGDFALPGDPANQACPSSENTGLHGTPDNWTVDTIFDPNAYLDRNGTVWIPSCPRAPEDTDKTYAYWSNMNKFAKTRFYQTYDFPVGSEPSGDDTFKFTGWYTGDTGVENPLGTPRIVVKVGLVAGDASQIIGEDVPNVEQTLMFSILHPSPWTQFTLTWKPPAGAPKLTAYCQATNMASGFNAAWFDAFVVEKESLCPDQPTITSYSPEMGLRGTSVSIDLNGTNFAGAPIVELLGPQTIGATTVDVISSTLVRATFDLPATAANGRYAIHYVQSPCNPITLNGAFEIYLESLQNGSFASPAAPAPPPDCTPAQIGSDFWLWEFIGTSGWPSGLVKNGWADGVLPALPACPPDNNYGTLSSKGNSGQVIRQFQKIAAQPNKQYVLSGKFSASGDINSAILIYDGETSTTPLGDQRVASNPSEFFDWRTDFVVGTTGSTTNYLTVAWMADVGGTAGMKAVHADDLKLAICDSPITVTGVTPRVAVNTGTLDVTDLAGTGFAGTPTVEFRNGSWNKAATEVNVVSPTKITCKIDLTGAPTGGYDVLVIQGDCMARLLSTSAETLRVGQPALVNGSFELPAETAPENPCDGSIGAGSGWRTNAGGDFYRDGQAPLPVVCPNPAATDAGHYGTLASDAGGTYRAWQTLFVPPGVLYAFSGDFTAPAGVTMTLRLLDGDETGTELASKPIGDVSAAWTRVTLEAVAPASGLMTAVWEVVSTGTEPNYGGHADLVEFKIPCNTPFADFNNDTFVDQLDFAFLQACFSGTGERTAECICADPDRNGKVDQADVNAFEACASGPGVAADPDCD